MQNPNVRALLQAKQAYTINLISIWDQIKLLQEKCLHGHNYTDALIPA